MQCGVYEMILYLLTILNINQTSNNFHIAMGDNLLLLA